MKKILLWKHQETERWQQGHSGGRALQRWMLARRRKKKQRERKSKVWWEIRLWVLFQPGSCRAPINHSHLLPPATILKYWWPHSDHSSTDPHSGAQEDLMYMQRTFPSHKHGLARLPEQISFLFYLMPHLPSPTHPYLVFFSHLRGTGETGVL